MLLESAERSSSLKHQRLHPRNRFTFLLPLRHRPPSLSKLPLVTSNWSTGRYTKTTELYTETTGLYSETTRLLYIETIRHHHEAGAAEAALTLTTITTLAAISNWWSAIVLDRGAEKTSARKLKPSKRSFTGLNEMSANVRSFEPKGFPMEDLRYTRNRSRESRHINRRVSRRTRKVGCPSACRNTDEGAPLLPPHGHDFWFCYSYRARQLTRTVQDPHLDVSEPCWPP
jgi:hypothetical protein